MDFLIYRLEIIGMLKNNFIKFISLVVLLGSTTYASATVTNLEIRNNTATGQVLVGSSTSGTFLPALSNPLPASTSTFHTSNTAGTNDGGVINYLSCRFQWSTLKVNGVYQFSRSATPASTCKVTVIAQNFTTGAYQLKFEVI
jgi:hypothetical protein